MMRHARGVLLLAGLVVLSGGRPTHADDPSLAEIARSLQEWKSAWVTLSVTWEERNPVQLRRYATDPAIKESDSLEDYFRTETWYIPDDGSWRREWTRTTAGEVVSRTIWCVNRQKNISFRSVATNEKHDNPNAAQLRVNTYNAVEVAERRYSLSPACAPLEALGTVSTPSELNLPDALAAGLGTMEGYETVDGVRTAKVIISTPSPDGGSAGPVLWLDSTHGWLPRRMESTDPKSDDVPLWSAGEFLQLPNGHWFPKSGTSWNGIYPEDEVDHWHVTQVAVNESFDRKLFEPPEPEEGTHVINKVTGFVGTWGVDNKPAAIREQEIADAAVAELERPAETVEAKLEWWSNAGPTVLMILAGGSLLGAWWIGRQRSQ